MPLLVPALPAQFVHEEDVGQALLRCVAAAGPPGAYNIAADEIITTADIARELGMLPVPIPPAPAQAAARVIAALPFLPPVAQWVEAVSHPAIMDTTRAKQELGWATRYTALEALRATLRPGSRPTPPPGEPHCPVSAMRSMTAALPGPATSRLTNGVAHPHPVKGGRWSLPSRRPPRSRLKPVRERSGTVA